MEIRKDWDKNDIIEDKTLKWIENDIILNSWLIKSCYISKLIIMKIEDDNWDKIEEKNWKWKYVIFDNLL